MRKHIQLTMLKSLRWLIESDSSGRMGKSELLKEIDQIFISDEEYKKELDRLKAEMLEARKALTDFRKKAKIINEDDEPGLPEQPVGHVGVFQGKSTVFKEVALTRDEIFTMQSLDEIYKMCTKDYMDALEQYNQ